jgi:hypothetical protein
VTISGLEAREVKIRLFGDVAIIHARTAYTTADGQAKSGRYRCLGAAERDVAGGFGARHPRLSLEAYPRADRSPPEPDGDGHCRRFP